MKRDKDVKKKDKKTETVVVIGRPYSLPKKFVEFQNGFEAEAKKTLQNCKGRRPDMMKAMEHRINAEGERAKDSIREEHIRRCEAIKNFRAQREKEKKEHESILDITKGDLERKQKEFEHLSQDSSLTTAIPFWATKWMIALMSIAFLALDSYLLFTFIGELNLNKEIKEILSIMFSVALAFLPVVIGYTFDRWVSPLENENSKERHKKMTFVFSGVYIAILLIVMALRFAFSRALLDDGGIFKLIAFSLLFSAIPLATGMLTAFVSYEAGNTARKKYINVENEIEKLKIKIQEEETVLVEYEKLDEKQRIEEDTEKGLFENALDLIQKECDALYARLLNI